MPRRASAGVLLHAAGLVAVLVLLVVLGALLSTAVHQRGGPAWLSAVGVGVPVLAGVLVVQRLRR